MPIADVSMLLDTARPTAQITTHYHAHSDAITSLFHALLLILLPLRYYAISPLIAPFT